MNLPKPAGAKVIPQGAVRRLPAISCVMKLPLFIENRHGVFQIGLARYAKGHGLTSSGSVRVASPGVSETRSVWTQGAALAGDGPSETRNGGRAACGDFRNERMYHVSDPPRSHGQSGLLGASRPLGKCDSRARWLFRGTGKKVKEFAEMADE
jgi:hypothetical protein